MPARVNAQVSIRESTIGLPSEAGRQDVGTEKEGSRVFPPETSDIWLKWRPGVACSRTESGVNGILSVLEAVCVNLERGHCSKSPPPVSAASGPLRQPSDDCFDNSPAARGLVLYKPSAGSCLGLKDPREQDHTYRVAFVQLKPALAMLEHKLLRDKAAVWMSWRCNRGEGMSLSHENFCI